METMVENNLYVAFKLNEEIYAIDIKSIKTVERLVPITRVPKVDDFISGVINLRGEIIPIIDLKKRFDMEASPITDDTRIMVMKIDDIQVGMMVDSVDEVLNISVDSIESASAVNSKISHTYVLGLGKVGNKIVTLLDFQKLTLGVGG